MILAAHQPNYLPWLGYFCKLANCDVFVVLDDVQFTRLSYQNRTRIKGPTGPLWLTQPILHTGRAKQITSDVEFDNRADWRAKHMKTLTANYGRGAHAVAMLELCRNWLGIEGMQLSQTNIRLIKEIAGLLGLRAEIVASSTLGVESTKADRIIDICRRMGAKTYLSGQGARAYQSEMQFKECGIELLYSDFTAREYPQLWDEFCPGLSIVDALFNVGPVATKAMLDDAR